MISEPKIWFRCEKYFLIQKSISSMIYEQNTFSEIFKFPFFSTRTFLTRNLIPMVLGATNHQNYQKQRKNKIPNPSAQSESEYKLQNAAIVLEIETSTNLFVWGPAWMRSAKCVPHSPRSTHPTASEGDHWLTERYTALIGGSGHTGTLGPTRRRPFSWLKQIRTWHGSHFN